MLACALHLAGQTLTVNLTLAASDKQGQPVTDLKPEELKISDEGKPESILQLRLNDDRRAASALGPHEYANRTPGTPAGATVVLFDLLNGNFTERESTILSLVKALNGVESPGNVYLYLLTNSGELYPIHPFPQRSDGGEKPDDTWTRQAKSLLDAAVRKIYGFRPVDDRDLGVRVVTTFDVLHALGAELGPLPGRKNIVWITNGFALNSNLGGYCRGLTIQGVLAPCSSDFIDFTPVVRHAGAELDAAGISMYSVNEWSVDGGQRVAVEATLSEFAGMTAGRTYPSGAAMNAIPDALRAAHLNYTLAYQPAAKSWDGKYHKIRVTTSRKGVQLQTEQGYIARLPEDDSVPLLENAAASNFNLPGIGLRAAVAAGASARARRIELRIDPADLSLLRENGHTTGQLALLYAAVTAQGPKQLRKAETLTIDWTAQQYDAAAKGGLTVGTDLAIPEGVREVRIVVVDSRANRVGSLAVPVS
jgi:VWFA-related protein